MSNAERLIAVLGPVLADEDNIANEAGIDRLATAVAELAYEDFACEMISVGGVAQTFEGADGMRAGLNDWVQMFTEMRFEVDDFRVIGENVLFFARMVGITRHGGVEMEQPSAAVWKFRDGRIYRVEWHMDRAAAERSAQSAQE
ncbi:MAG: nuclear transport factor 2 family protein [Solirubrobacterales bacterium]